jgi:H2-forming N5,N10-methylenetetrahydromethanopterin dehydrogenase-like enzyme
MKKTITVFGLFLLFFGCGNNILKKPENLIDKDIMIDILYDLSIIEALHNTSYGSGMSKFNSNNFILKKYKIDSLQFAKSNQYYATDVKNYKKMYEQVSNRLTEKDAEILKKMLKKTGKQAAP